MLTPIGKIGIKLDVISMTTTGYMADEVKTSDSAIQNVVVEKFRPQTWGPGQSGNPKGRKSAGLSILEWINQLQEMESADLRHIADDRRVAVNKRVAAKTWLRAVSNAKNASGNHLAGSEIDRIIDRTHGKAMQNVQVTHLDAAALDLTRLSVEQVATFRELLSIATGHDLQTTVTSLPE